MSLWRQHLPWHSQLTATNTCKTYDVSVHLQYVHGTR